MHFFADFVLILGYAFSDMYNNPQPNFEPYIESVDWNAVNTIRLVGDYDWGSAEVSYPLLYVNDSLVYRSSSYLEGERCIFIQS